MEQVHTEKRKLNGIERFKKTIKFIVSIIISREFAFIYCVLGTTAQVGHTYFLVDSISSLSGNWRMIQAIILSVFISSSLLYFVAIADKDEKDEFRKVEQSIIVFTIIEIIINIYYYTRHLLLDVWKDNLEPNYFDYIFACIIGILIPVTIKMYSSHIKAKEWLKEFTQPINNDVNENYNTDLQNRLVEMENKLEASTITAEQLEIMSKRLDEALERDFGKLDVDMATVNREIEEKVESAIIESFKKNQDKFVNQFENKLKLIAKQTENNNNIE